MTVISFKCGRNQLIFYRKNIYLLMFRIMPIKKMPGPLKSLSFALTLFAFVIGGQESWGQEIQNLSVKLENHDIIITFDLKSAAHPQELFDVFIYGSHDNYSKAIEVKEGKTKD